MFACIQCEPTMQGIVGRGWTARHGMLQQSLCALTSLSAHTNRVHVSVYYTECLIGGSSPCMPCTWFCLDRSDRLRSGCHRLWRWRAVKNTLSVGSKILQGLRQAQATAGPLCATEVWCVWLALRVSVVVFGLARDGYPRLESRPRCHQPCSPWPVG